MSNKASHLERNKKRFNESNIPPNIQMDQLVKLFWEENPYIKKSYINDELEIRFGTLGFKPLTKIDYDNVIKKMKSFGFTTYDENGSYFLRMNNEYLDPKTGNFQLSKVRTEITGIRAIQEYCKNKTIWD